MEAKTSSKLRKTIIISSIFFILIYLVTANIQTNDFILFQNSTGSDLDASYWDGAAFTKTNLIGTLIEPRNIMAVTYDSYIYVAGSAAWNNAILILNVSTSGTITTIYNKSNPNGQFTFTNVQAPSLKASVVRINNNLTAFVWTWNSSDNIFMFDVFDNSNNLIFSQNVSTASPIDAGYNRTVGSFRLYNPNGTDYLYVLMKQTPVSSNTNNSILMAWNATGQNWFINTTLMQSYSTEVYDGIVCPDIGGSCLIYTTNVTGQFTANHTALRFNKTTGAIIGDIWSPNYNSNNIDKRPIRGSVEICPIPQTDKLMVAGVSNDGNIHDFAAIFNSSSIDPETNRPTHTATAAYDASLYPSFTIQCFVDRANNQTCVMYVETTNQYGVYINCYNASDNTWDSATMAGANFFSLNNSGLLTSTVKSIRVWQNKYENRTGLAFVDASKNLWAGPTWNGSNLTGTEYNISGNVGPGLGGIHYIYMPLERNSATTTPATPSLSVNMTSCFSFDEGTGNIVSDIGGRNNGSLVGGASFNATTYKFGNAVTFNGVSGYIEFNNTNLTNTSYPYTISAWVNAMSYGEGGFGMIYSKTGSFELYNDASGDLNRFEIYYYEGGGKYIFTESKAAILNNWQHVVITFDGGNSHTFYVNGTNVTANTDVNSVANAKVKSYIGADGPSSGYTYYGTIDEVAFWNRSLNSSEVAQLYNNHTGYNCSTLYYGETTPATPSYINPTSSIIYPTATTYNRTWMNFSIYGTANSSTPNVSLYINGTLNITNSTYTNGTYWIYNLTLGYGTWIAIANTKDINGTEINSSSVTFTLENQSGTTPPTTSNDTGGMSYFSDSNHWWTKNIWGVKTKNYDGQATMNNISHGQYTRFQVPYSMNVTRLCHYFSAVSGFPPNVRVGILSDITNWGTNINDTSTYLGWFAVNPAAGWNCGDIYLTQNLSTSTTYYLVVGFNNTGTLDGSNYVRITTAGTINGYHFPDSFIYSNWAEGWKANIWDMPPSGGYQGATTKIFALQLDNGQAWGFPYYSTFSYDSSNYPGVRGNYVYAQRFMPTLNITPKNITVMLFMQGSPNDNITMEIRDESNTILTFCKLQNKTTWPNTCTFNNNIQLNSQTIYYLFETCAGCDSSNYFMVMGSSVEKYGATTNPESWMRNATLDGETSYLLYSSDNGTALSDRKGKKLDDMGFDFGYTSKLDAIAPVVASSINNTAVFDGFHINMTANGTAYMQPYYITVAPNLSACWFGNGTANFTATALTSNFSTCSYVFTGGALGTVLAWTAYFNDTDGNIGSSTQSLTVSTYTYNVINLTHSWRRYVNTVTDKINITAYVQANQAGGPEINTSFYVNGSVVCSNVTTFSSTAPLKIDCEYTVNNNIAIIQAETNSTGTKARTIGIFKDHPFFEGINYTEQKLKLNSSTSPVATRFASFLGQCVANRNYTIGGGYWRGDVLLNMGYCWQYTGDTAYRDRAIETMTTWCNYSKATLDTFGQDKLFVMMRSSETYDLVADGLTATQRYNISSCLYQWADWYWNSTGELGWSDGNGQGFENGYGLGPFIAYQENNTYNDPMMEYKTVNLTYWGHSHLNWLGGLFNDSTTGDGRGYKAYGGTGGITGLFIGNILYPNGEFVEKLQGTFCKFYAAELYGIVKTTVASTYTSSAYIRRLNDDRDANAYDDRGCSGGGEWTFPWIWMVAARYCLNDDIARGVGIWGSEYQFNNSPVPTWTTNNPNFWMSFYDNKSTSKDPKSANLSTTYKSNRVTENGYLYWRSGWDVLSKGTAEDTVIQMIADDSTGGGHPHADDGSLVIYPGSVFGGDELWTDGGPRADNEDDGLGDDTKQGDKHHNVLMVDNKEGGNWNDVADWTPSSGYQLLEGSNYLSTGINNCGFGNNSAGGLDITQAGGWPNCTYYPRNYSGYFQKYNSYSDGSLSVELHKTYYGGTAGQYLHWTRNVLIFNNSERTFVIAYDKVDNPTTTDHAYSLNWVTATNAAFTTGNITVNGNGYLITNGAARGYYENVYPSTGFTYNMNKETFYKGMVRCDSPVYYEKTTFSSTDFTTSRNLSAISLLVPYTTGQTQPLALYAAEDLGTKIKVRLLGVTTTYEINFTKDNSVAVEYSTYNTTVPFVALLGPDTGSYINSSTIQLNCSITSANAGVQNMSIYLDGVVNYTATINGTTATVAFTISGVNDGAHTWTCQGYDNQSVISNMPGDKIINVDTVLPTLTYVSIPTNEIRPLLNISSNENLVNLTYSLNNANFAGLCVNCINDASTNLWLAEGINTIIIKAYDNALNIQTTNYTFTTNLSGTFRDDYNNSLYISSRSFVRNLTSSSMMQFWKLNRSSFTPVSWKGAQCFAIQAEDYDALTGQNIWKPALGAGLANWTIMTENPPGDAGYSRNYSGTGYMLAQPFSSYGYGTNYYYPNMSCINYYIEIPNGQSNWTLYGRNTNINNETLWPEYNYYSFSENLYIDGEYRDCVTGNHDGYVWRRCGDTSAISLYLEPRHDLMLEVCQNRNGVKFDVFELCNQTVTQTYLEIPTSSVRNSDAIGTGNYTSIWINTTDLVQNITLNWTATDGGLQARVTADGATWTTVTNGVKSSVTAGRTVQYVFLFQDLQTINVTDITLTFEDTVNTVNNPPIPLIIYPIASTYNRTWMNFSFYATDDFNTTFNLTLFINNTLNVTNNTYSNGTYWLPNITLSYGNYVTILQGCDLNLSCANSSSVTFTLSNSSDTQAPVISAPSTNNSNPYVNDAILISSTITDLYGLSHCWIYDSLSGTNSTTMSLSSICSKAYNMTSAGTYNFIVYANDTSNNVGTSSILSATVSTVSSSSSGGGGGGSPILNITNITSIFTPIINTTSNPIYKILNQIFNGNESVINSLAENIKDLVKKGASSELNKSTTFWVILFVIVGLIIMAIVVAILVRKR